MSLEAFNAPPLVGALTAGCYGLLPFVARHPMLVAGTTASLPFGYIKSLNALSYALAFISTSRPGRYDGAASVTEKDGMRKTDPKTKSDAATRRGMEQMSPSKGRTLVPPAPWAFIIWAPIFLGESVMVVAPLGTKISPNAEAVLREVSGPYAMAQIFTALWTASFRPKYGSKGGIYKYVSALGLAGIATSLNSCHTALCGSKRLTGGEYALFGLPLALHFGWTTAASLVNLNGMFAMRGDGDAASPEAEASDARSVALLGHASVVLATAIGVGITWTRKAPVYGGVIAWALAAVASGLKQRLQARGKDTETLVGIYGAELQRLLSLIGATISALTAAVVVLIR